MNLTDTKNFKKKIIIFITTGGFVGKIPFAPGTFGTLAGIPFVFFLNWINADYKVFGVIFLIIFSIWICDKAEKIFNKKDPGCIVIDEIAGFVVAMAGIPITFLNLFLGFFIFRFFDILKPPPIRNFEKKFNNGAGVVLDDIVAGLFTFVVLKIILMIL